MFNRKHFNHTVDLSGKKRLVFVLPVFEETEMIVQTIGLYEKEIEKYKNIDFVIVGTAKERNDKNINGTLELAKKKSQGNTHIHVIEYPGVYGYMAHQVNFACRYLIEQGYVDDTTRVHIINIDSRVKDEYFREVTHYIHQNQKILLQSAMFTLNFEKLGFLSKGTSIVQSRRTITGEQRRLLLNLHLTDLKLYHVVGHGLIINLKTFFQYGLFPEDTFNEDMHFGYYLSVKKETVIPLKSYEEADMPETFLDWWKQAGGRFIGAMDYYKYMRSYMRKFNQTINLRIIVLTIQGLYNAIKWLLVSYLIWTLLLLAIYINSFEFYIVGVLCVVVYMLHYRLTILFLQRGGYIKKRKISYFIGALLVVSIRSFPATIGLIKYFLHSIGILTIKKYKSVHA